MIYFINKVGIAIQDMFVNLDSPSLHSTTILPIAVVVESPVNGQSNGGHHKVRRHP
jgi:hypothetical protein